jgi:hypothetical protein
VPRLHELLAFAYASGGRPLEALASSNDALRLGSTTGFVFASRARAYELLNRHDDAAGAWRVAVHRKRGTFWVYRAMLARSLARGGHAQAALAALDSARVALHADTLATALLVQVRQAVQRDCFASAPPGGCTDPLAGWALTSVVPGPERVADRPGKSQNASIPGPAR